MEGKSVRNVEVKGVRVWDSSGDCKRQKICHPDQLLEDENIIEVTMGNISGRDALQAFERGKTSRFFAIAQRDGPSMFPTARGYGLRTGEPRQGRNAATVTFFALP